MLWWRKTQVAKKNHLIFMDNQGGNFLLANFSASRVYQNWVPVSNCSCPHLYLYVVVLELDLKQTNDVSKHTGEDNNILGLEPRLGCTKFLQ